MIVIFSVAILSGGNTLTERQKSTGAFYANCVKMHQKRDDLLKVRNETKEMIKRNIELQRSCSPNRISAINKLELSYSELKRKDVELKRRYDLLIEKLIKVGCPDGLLLDL